jgi:molecular chaperone GrpE
VTGIYETPDGEVSDVVGADVADLSADVDTDTAVTGADAEVIDAEVVEDTDDTADTDAADEDPFTALTAQRDEYLDSLRRLQAEFENYRKRVSKQQAEQAERVAVSLVDKLLPVLDALDLAAAHLGDAESDDARALVAASALLNGALIKEGLERVDPLGEPFDPNAHEAVGHLPDEDGVPIADASPVGQDGASPEDAGSDVSTPTPTPTPTLSPGEPVVAQVMRAGYRWRGSVVRPAMVMVRG